MLSDGGTKSRLGGNVDGGIVAIEQRGGGDHTDLVFGLVGRSLHESGHDYGGGLVPVNGAKLPVMRLPRSAH